VTASPLDSPVLRGHLGDEAAARLFTDAAELRAMMLFEGALAEAQAELGIVPAEAGEAIARAAREALIDPSALAEGTAADGVSVPAFVTAFRAQLPEAAAPWLHFGATSQDVLDTALVLRLRAHLALIEERIAAILAALGPAAARWAELPMTARTRGQAATPTTFGARIAIWGAPFLRARARQRELAPRVITLSFAGASGTSAAYGPEAAALAEGVGRRLGLPVPDLPWHAARDGLAELAAHLGILAGAAGKMGRDLLLLGQSEVGELRAGLGGGSSTMPQKVNPVSAEGAVALARLCSRLSGGLQEAMLADHERDGSAWTLEWLTLPQLCVAAAGALRHAQAMAETLAPDGARMAANLAATGGLVMAEAAAFRLAEVMPRPEASAAVKAAARRAAAEGRPLAETLAEALAGGPGAEIDWAEALDPARGLGRAPEIARRFAAMAAARDG